MVAAILLAFTSRVFFPLPFVKLLHARWVPTMLVAIALVALFPLLHGLFRALHRVAARRDAAQLASDLEQRFDWHQDATTALALSDQERAKPVPRFLVAQTAGRLREVKGSKLWPQRTSRLWVRALMAIVFAFILLGPGVDGLARRMGLGRGDPAGIGATKGDPDSGAPRPWSTAVWFRRMVEEPVRVEALPPTPEEQDEVNQEGARK